MPYQEVSSVIEIMCRPGKGPGNALEEAQGLTNLASAVTFRSVIPSITAATSAQNTGTC